MFPPHLSTTNTSKQYRVPKRKIKTVCYFFWCIWIFSLICNCWNSCHSKHTLFFPRTIATFLPKSIPSSSTCFYFHRGNSRGNSASPTQQGQVKESQINLNKYYRFFFPGRGADFPRTIHHGPPNLKTQKWERKREPQKKKQENLVIDLLPFLFVIATFTSTPIPANFPFLQCHPSYYLLLWAGHAILPHHDLGAIRGDPLQLSSVFQHHFLHKLDRILQTTSSITHHY